MGQTMRKTGEGFKERLKGLKAYVVALQKQARELKERAGPLGATSRPKRCAVVERSRCTGCGLCEQLCPVRAIRVTYVAKIDAQRCTGCGICVENCPQGAVHLATAGTTPAREARNA